MASAAVDELKQLCSVKFVRRTVPGVKDLPLAAKQLLDEGCDIVMAFGMPGAKPIDKQCAHESSLGIQRVQLMTAKTVLEVFVHEDEAQGDEELGKIMFSRASRHAINLLWMLFSPHELEKRAGSGQRQGRDNAEVVGVRP